MPRNTKAPDLSSADERWLMQAADSRFEVVLGQISEPTPEEEHCRHPLHSRPACLAKQRKKRGHDYHTWRATDECNTPSYCDECGSKHQGGDTIYCPRCGCNNLEGESPNRAEPVTIGGIGFASVSLLTPDMIAAELEGVTSYLRESRILDWEKEDFGVNGNETEDGDDESDLILTDWLLVARRAGRYFMGCAVGSPRPSPKYPEGWISPEEEWRIVQKERQQSYFTCRPVGVEKLTSVFTDSRSEDERQADEDNRSRPINEVLKEGCCS